MFSVSGALEDLTEDVADGEAVTTTRLRFARGLKYAEYYEHALAITDRVLIGDSHHLEALALQGGVYVRQGVYDSAQAAAEQILAHDDRHVEAWEILADVHEARQDWGKLLVAATRVIEVNEASGRRSRYVLLQRTRAGLELGDFEGVERDLEAASQPRSLADRVAEPRAEMTERRKA